ncbi:hypothetical protein O9X98_09695 [Agrobacterium salinitolerans]|nr:hypothetical protein [Agrobacterium salinitolerans]
MLTDFHKPSLFRHAIVKMRHADRFTEDDVNWKPKKRDEDGWTFSNEANAVDERFISHGDVYSKLVSGGAKIRYGYNDPENQRLRAIFGDDTFSDIVGKRRDLALFREKLIKRFDAEWLTLGKKPRWSKEMFEAKLRAWRREIIADNGNPRRSSPVAGRRCQNMAASIPHTGIHDPRSEPREVCSPRRRTRFS